jgi:hypothetical protein
MGLWQKSMESDRIGGQVKTLKGVVPFRDVNAATLMFKLAEQELAYLGLEPSVVSQTLSEMCQSPATTRDTEDSTFVGEANRENKAVAKAILIFTRHLRERAASRAEVHPSRTLLGSPSEVDVEKVVQLTISSLHIDYTMLFYDELFKLTVSQVIMLFIKWLRSFYNISFSF